MNMLLYEDKFKYSAGIYLVLAIPLVFLLALGYLFYLDVHKKDIFPSESADESELGAKIIWASALFVLLVYWLSLPRKILIFSDRIKLKYGLFLFPVSFANIEGAKPASGIPLFAVISSVTSFSTQVEIVRKNGMNIRISPFQRDRFLESLESALSAWQRMSLPK